VRGFAHRQGILSAAGAVAVATGNDLHAIAALAHAYAESPGRRALAVWTPDTRDRLHGSLTLPVPVALPAAGPVPHPGVQVALKILGVKNADELAHVVAAAGLAQNLAALHASARAPILPGHLARQAHALARAAGAEDELVERVAQQLLSESNVKLERAQELVAELAHG
jgi:hydroxymethylglutaryl-CoA reductase